MVKALQALAAGTNRRYGRSHREVIDPFAVANPTWRAASRKRPYTTRCAASSDLGKGARQTVCASRHAKKTSAKDELCEVRDLRHARPHDSSVRHLRQAALSTADARCAPGVTCSHAAIPQRQVDEPALANQLYQL